MTGLNTRSIYSSGFQNVWMADMWLGSLVMILQALLKTGPAVFLLFFYLLVRARKPLPRHWFSNASWAGAVAIETTDLRGGKKKSGLVPLESHHKNRDEARPVSKTLSEATHGKESWKKSSEQETDFWVFPQRSPNPSNASSCPLTYF